MGLLSTFTGGKSDDALDALKRSEQYFSSVQTPTIQQLTLPELQKYVEAGILTPAQAQAYLQQTDAYANQDIDQTGTGAQIQALNQLSQVADAGAEGTPMQQAQMENSLQRMNTAIGGQRGAIEQSMAARGTPYALIQAALANQTVGQEGQQAHMDAVNAQAAAYQNALNAMSQGGALGGQLQGQQNAQANTISGAANAMQQFNAANQQQNSQFNAANQMAANTANAANKQQVSNNNTGLSNARTQYNANLPQQVYNNQMQKASGQAGAATNIGNMQQAQGGQTAGIIGGLINTATSFIPKPPGGAPGGVPTNQNQPQYAAHGGIIRKPPPDVGSSRGMIDYDLNNYMAKGGYIDDNGRICMDDGGMVPGEAPFAGDTMGNDIVPANLSPGEAVIPRSSVAQNPEIVSSLMSQESEPVDVQDVVTLLKAMRAIRVGG